MWKLFFSIFWVFLINYNLFHSQIAGYTLTCGVVSICSRGQGTLVAMLHVDRSRWDRPLPSARTTSRTYSLSVYYSHSTNGVRVWRKSAKRQVRTWKWIVQLTEVFITRTILYSLRVGHLIFDSVRELW